MYTHVTLCGYEPIHVGAQRDQEMVSDPLEWYYRQVVSRQTESAGN